MSGRANAKMWVAVLALGPHTAALAADGSRGERPVPQPPGVTVEEAPARPGPIQPTPTGVTAFIGRTARGPVNSPTAVRRFAEFEQAFGGLHVDAPLTYAVRSFFANGGGHALIVRVHRPEARLNGDATRPARPGAVAPTDRPDGIGRPVGAATLIGDRAARTGLYALEKAELFDLLCVPPDIQGGDTPPAVFQQALHYCVERRAMLLVDPPAAWSKGKSSATAADAARNGLSDLGLAGPESRNAALYFPRLRVRDPLRGRQEIIITPSGAVAGVIARTDAQRGVWKAPAGSSAVLVGIEGPDAGITDADQDGLNTAGINCLRTVPAAGLVVWGARTLTTDPEWRYVSVRRLALHVATSIAHGLEWAVFEPNAEPLWAQIRARVGDFLGALWRQGAFQGQRPDHAYYVRCGRDTTTDADIQRGVALVEVGCAPVKPAEFLILRHEQMCGQLSR